MDLQSTNKSNNNTNNTFDSNVNNNMEVLNWPTRSIQLTTSLLTTKYCHSEIIALKEQTERQNIEIQALKALFKEQVYILKKSLEELANPVNNKALITYYNLRENNSFNKKSTKITYNHL